MKRRAPPKFFLKLDDPGGRLKRGIERRASANQPPLPMQRYVEELLRQHLLETHDEAK